jgi:biopolymer transport protein ExbD
MLNIAVDQAGIISISNIQIGLGELHTIVSNRIRINTNTSIYISGDRMATHGSIIRVLDAVRLEGVEKVSFAISPEEKK